MANGERKAVTPEDLLARTQVTPESLLEKARGSLLGKAANYVSGVGEAVQQGFSLGLKDEVSALGGTVGTSIGNAITGQPLPEFGAEYQRNLEEERRPGQEFREANPKSALVSELAGGIASGAPVKAAVQSGVSLLRNALSAGTLGAVSGAGFSEGDVTDKALSAGGGFLLGSGLTAALTPITRWLGNWSQRAMTKTERTAFNSLMRAFERDGIPIEDATRRLQQWQKAGAKPEVLADLGGDNVRGVLRATVSTPSQSRALAEQTLGPRQFQQSERVYRDALEALAPGSMPRTAAERLTKFRSVGAELLYETAYEMPMRAKGDVYSSDDLIKILNRPTMKKAIAEATRQAQDLGKELPKIVDDKGNVVHLPDMETLDWIKKQGLDSVIEKFRDPVTGRMNTKDPEIRTLLSLKEQYLNVLDDLSPAYRSARNAFAGPSEALNAMSLGRDFLKNFRREPAITEGALKKMTEGEKEFFRVGVAQSIQDILETAPDGANAVRRVFGTPRLREALRLLMPNEEAMARFEVALERESNMFRTNRAAGFDSGSPTAKIIEEVTDLASDMGITPGNVLQEIVKSPRDVAARLIEGLSKESNQALKADVADAVGKILLTGEPEEIAKLLARLQRVSRTAFRTDTAERTVGKVSGILGGLGAAEGTR